MNKKKSLALLLVLAMAISVFAAGCGKKDPANPAEPSDPGNGETPQDETGEATGQITIGQSTEMTGEWGSSYFQNNAADKAIRDLIYGYATVEYDKDGQFHLNETVVENHEETENEDGSKTHKFIIKEDLTYDDGTPITAKDYVASIMFWSSSVIGDMGGGNTAGQDFVGWNEFATGESKIFPGVNLLGDYEFAFTFDPSKVPYFYELAMASAGPLKLDFWTDETVDILDDGEGCYFTDNFTVENFEDRINEARREVPRPSTGPYYLKSYDEATKTAVVEVNESFKGNFEGVKPRIKTIIQKKVTDQTSLDELAVGSIDILPKLASGVDINGAFNLHDQGGYSFSEYPRAGYGNIRFSCDFGPTADKEVRQALAHLLDRNEFAKSFTGGFGTVVHGPYGEGSWFYQETKSELESQINQYPYDLEKAKQLLDEAGWNLDANGGAYESGLRHKKDADGNIVPLVIEWASTENNEVSDLLVIKLQENPDLEEAGIKINQTAMAFGELLNYMYRDATQGDKYGVPSYHMFNLASNFPVVYDRKNDVTTDDSMIKRGYNVNRLKDKDLEQAALDMVYINPGDTETFKEKFVEFIVRWNDLLPDLPLYSNQYHDFYNEKLKDYEPTAFYDVTMALIYAYVEE